MERWSAFESYKEHAPLEHRSLHLGRDDDLIKARFFVSPKDLPQNGIQFGLAIIELSFVLHLIFQNLKTKIELLPRSFPGLSDLAQNDGEIIFNILQGFLKNLPLSLILLIR